ncbi:outer membrane beta-barrel protein [Crocinitomix catalasitica]|uniref:outer membrane beta-barrel protein n=1 Tax=Crocinitomix catalasitica TaxID=184607 RepID=UPI0004865B2C|nr:outer membrane beta-barrel protein [Crocinitomix catalasitica]
MKKLLSAVLILGISSSLFAQEKKFQVGLVLGPTFNWTKIQTNKIERNGIGNGFTIGMGGNYMFNENIGLALGIQFDLESFKLNYGNDADNGLGEVFYAYTDTEIKRFKDGVVEEFSDTTGFQLTTRKFRAKYITIPLFLKFQTNKIGSMIYYGKFGLRTSILAGVRMDDTGFDASYNNAEGAETFSRIVGAESRTLENMKPGAVKKGLAAVRTGVGIYGGAEWNFTGSTFLYFEGGFTYGITPALYQKSSHLVEKVEVAEAPGKYTYTNLDIKNNPQHIIEIKIGLLF